MVDDSRLYANIAENWLQHGIYGMTNSGVIMPTLSRLPGYPAFLAAIFALFGDENFRAVLLVQVLFDLATCFLIADLARRLFGGRAAQAAFLLAALCPFLANYAAAALTETLEIFFTALALDLAFCGLRESARAAASRKRLAACQSVWLGCGLVDRGRDSAAARRRDPARSDRRIPALAAGAQPADRQRPAPALRRATIFWAGVLVAVGATAPLIPWTLRNLHTLHRFEPLAPRYANDSDELVMNGFNRWVKTWTADYVSVQEIYWNVPGSDIDVTRLPRRAFDSDAAADTNQRTLRRLQPRPRHDSGTRRALRRPGRRARFMPLRSRYYVWLPALRIADMWLRPRTELFPSDPRWWEFNDDRRWLAVSLAFGLINLVYVALAAAGLVRAREFFGIGLFVLFLAAAFRIPRDPGKSRAPLHAGMLSRGHSSGLSALSPVCINFQIWKRDM